MKLDRITYAGHSAVFLAADNFVAAVDPWLEGNPLCPDSLKNPKQLDLIVLTHGHADHASDAARVAASTGAAIAATYELAMLMIAAGVPSDHVIPMNKGGTVEHKGLRITLTHALHSNSFDTPSGTAYAGEACGVVIRDQTRAVYHAGDTALFSDMKLIKEHYAPEVALLPIGDCFTMGPEEAALAAEWVGCRVAIPIHHSTFPLLTGTVEAFQSECSRREIEVVPLEPGATHSLAD